MRGITWLASYPKSGNTWVRMFLAAYRNGGVALHPNALPSDLDAADISDEHYAAVSPVALERLSRERLLSLRGAALLHVMAMAHVRPLVCKTHWQRCNFEHVEVFPPALSDKAVYVVRDPRDVAVSFARWMGKDMDETIAIMGDSRTKLDGINVKALCSYLGTWSEHVASWASREDTLVIRYEDLLATPTEVFMGLLAHIGIGIDENRVRQAVGAVSFDRLREMEGRGRFIETPEGVDSFFHRGQAGQWREALTAEQTARIEADHGDWMSRMGYLDDASSRVA